MKPIDNFLRSLRRSGQPATVALIAALAATYVLAWITKSPFLSLGLASSDLNHIWTTFTYPFASTGNGSDFIWLLIELWWFYMIGGDVERSLRVPRYLAFFFISTVLGALALQGLAIAVHGRFLLDSPLIPLASLTVAWAVKNKSSQVLLGFMIPVKGVVIGWIMAGIVLFSYGYPSPIFGVAGLIPLGLAFAFASDMIPGYPYEASRKNYFEKKQEEKKAQLRFDEIAKRKRERQEKERLRQLFERSLIDDPDDKKD